MRDLEWMERLTMRKVREVLRLKFECGLSQREISASCGISTGSVNDYLRRAEAAQLTWEAASELGDADVEARLFRHVGRNEPPTRSPIDFAWVHRELCKVAVTLQLLWIEYAEAAQAKVDGTRPYQYSQFCDRYAAWRATLALSMRQVHRAGEKAFVDYSGKKPSVVDRVTGEVRDVELFVAVLGASSYTYAEATRTQQLADFVSSNIRTFEYFGRVPHVVVPDQLRSAVSGPDRYEPSVNATYLEMAQHYGVAVIPARPRKPKDKAKVEGGVLIAQRWILASLRNRLFFSIDELNVAIAELLEKLNSRPFQKLEGCRRSAFEAIDRPAMKSLPATRYELAEWEKAKVNIDHHVVLEDRLYSVSYTLIGARVELRATVGTVEVFHGGARVASHRRSYGPKGTSVTCEEHRPPAHRGHTAWPPERMSAWAATFGPSVARVVDLMMARYPHPDSAYRACLGMMRCAQKYGPARAEAACARALAVAGPVGPTRKHIEAMLKRGLDRAPAPQASINTPPLVHENVRGGDYYDKEETRDHGRNDPEVARNEAAHDGEGAPGAAGDSPRQPTLF
jgi:transposase